MNLYIAYTHFGHKNAIAFDRRLFADVREMDEVMIRQAAGSPDFHPVL